MKKLLVMVVSGFALLFSVSVLADSDVGVIDLGKILKDSPQVQKIQAEMEKKFKPQQDKMQGLGESIQKDTAKLQKGQAVMSKADVKALQVQIAKETGDFQKLQGSLQADFMKARNDKMDELMADLKAAAKKVADKKDIDLVLPANVVVYAEDVEDITQEVMDAM